MSDFQLTDDQQHIFNELVKFTEEQYQNNMILVTGYAGVGKTALINQFIKWYGENSSGLFQNCAVTAPTHKAVKVLKKFGIESDLSSEKVEYSTLHSILGLKPEITNDGTQIFVKDPKMKSKLAFYDLIIVDEASMIDDTLFSEIINQNVRNSKIIFVGDPEQIPPVSQDHSIPFIPEQQAAYGIPVLKLDKIIRQAEKNPIIQISKSVRENRFERLDTGNLLAEDSDGHGVYFLPKTQEGRQEIQNLLKTYFKSDEFQEDSDYAKVIAWRNKTVDDFNKVIRKFMYGADVAKIVQGEKLIADRPVFDKIGMEIIINTNEDLVVQSLVQDTKTIYNIPFQFYKIRAIGDEGESKDIDVIHESSEIIFQRLLTKLANEAKDLPKGSKRINAWKNYYETREMFAEVKYNYAITAHKSQGSTYSNAFVIATDINANTKPDEKRRILYTACTRPKERLYII